ncbi:MAG: DNA-directed RNA polymerase subunit omega [Deltaproteobacteria bacterium]|nr:MAG: DNA-directed RNA polymerase subunit omega [Deltaproteobacteria bacterium]
MARITVEDCLKKGYNKFMLVHLAAKRVVQMRKGKEPLVECNNREIVTALREIEEDRVRLRPEASPSEAFLEMEPELPAPTGDLIEPETTGEADGEMGAEAGAETGAQGKPESAAEAGAEMNAEVQEEGEPKAESEADAGEDEDQSTSEKA